MGLELSHFIREISVSLFNIYESRLSTYESRCFFCQEIFLFSFFFSFDFSHVANFLIVLNTQKLNHVGFFCLFFLAVLYSMQDLSFWTRD